MALTHRSLFLFPSIVCTSSTLLDEPSSPRLVRQLDGGAPSEMAGKEVMEEDDVSLVDSAEVDSVLRDMMSDDESITLEADEDEDPVGG